MSNEKGTEFGIRFTATSAEADRVAARLEGLLHRVGETAAQTTQRISQTAASGARFDSMMNRWVDTTKTAAQGVDKEARRISNAFAQLPLQITDIFTSLAGGSNPFLVMVQQGGQIKDSFGGVSNAIKHIIEAIGPARLAFGALALAAAGVVGAHEAGAAEARNMARAIQTTGNYAGQTVGQLRALAQENAGLNITIGQSKDTVKELAGSGLITREAFQSAAKAVGEFARATGQDLDDVRPMLIKVFADPAKGAAELNRTMHFLTAAQLQHIENLQREGKLGEAQLELSDRLRDSVKGQADQLTFLGKQLQGVKTLWSDFWDAALGIGRPETIEEKIKSARSALDGLQAPPATRAGPLGMLFGGPGSQRQINAAQGVLSSLEAQQQAEGDQAWARAWRARAEQNKTAWNKLVEANLANSQRASKEINEATATAIEAGMDPDSPEVKQTLARIKQKYGKETLDLSFRTAVQTIEGDRDQIESAYKSATEFFKSQLDQRAIDQAQYINVMSALEEERLANLIETYRKEETAAQAHNKTADAQRAANAAAGAERQMAGLGGKREQDLASLAAKQKATLEQSLLQVESLADSYARDFEARMLQMQVMSTTARQLQLDQLAVEEKARANEDTLARQLQKGEITREQYAQGMDRLTDVINEQKTAVQFLADEQDRLNRSWVYGARQALQEYQDAATNVAAQVKDVFTNAFEGMTDALTDFVMTGKLDFKSLVEDVVRGLIRMQMQAALSTIFKAIGGAVTGTEWYQSTQPSVIDGGTVIEGYEMPTAAPSLTASGGPAAAMAAARAPMQVNFTTNNNAASDVATTGTATENDQGGVDIELAVDRLTAKNLGTHGSASNRAARRTLGAAPPLRRT